MDPTNSKQAKMRENGEVKTVEPAAMIEAATVAVKLDNSGADVEEWPLVAVSVALIPLCEFLKWRSAASVVVADVGNGQNVVLISSDGLWGTVGLHVSPPFVLTISTLVS